MLAPRSLLSDALAALPKPGATHPFMQYLNGITASLKSQGLHTSAEGVRVFIAGEDNFVETVPRKITDHTVSVAAFVGGPASLAQGATIEVLLGSKAAIALPKGFDEATVVDLGKIGLANIVNDVSNRRSQVQAVMARAPNDGQVTLVNMSNTTTLLSQAASLAQNVLTSPPGSPMRASLERVLGRPAKQSDAPALANAIVDELKVEFEKNPKVLNDAREGLTRDVAEARKRGILIFKAAGNEQVEAKAAGVSGKGADVVDGMIVIGAIDLGKNATDPSDNSVARFSVEGPVLGAVGVKVPYKGKDISGTSMASPLSASVAALMIKNNPRITVDQIEAILKQTAVPVKGGLNEIDVVRAIALAKARAK